MSNSDWFLLGYFLGEDNSGGDPDGGGCCLGFAVLLLIFFVLFIVGLGIQAYEFLMRIFNMG